MDRRGLLGSLGIAAAVSGASILVQYFASAASSREEVLLWVGLGALVGGLALVGWITCPLRRVPVRIAVISSIEERYDGMRGWELRVRVEGAGPTSRYDAEAEWARPTRDARPLDHPPWTLVWEKSRGLSTSLGNRVRDGLRLVHVDEHGTARPIVHDGRTVHPRDLHDDENVTELLLTVSTPGASLRPKQVRFRFVPDEATGFALSLVE